MAGKKKQNLMNCKTDAERAEFFEQESGFDLLDKGLMVEETPSALYRKKPRKERQLNIRVEPGLIETIKEIALDRGLAYQTLIRMWIQEKVQEEK